MKLKFQPTHSYVKDSGLVLVLALLLIAYWKGSSLFLLLAIGTLVIVMTIPVIFKPMAVIWYYFSTALGNITNRIILTVVYGIILTPVGVIRRFLGSDPMKRKEWKNGSSSVFTERKHVFVSDDFNRPY